MATENTKNQGPQTEAFSIGDILGMCLNRWWWFVISVIVCMGCATWYLLKTPNVYTRSATILIKSDKSGRQMASVEDNFSDLGMVGVSTNVSNEMETLRSPDLTAKVVESLRLDKNYSTDGRFRRETLYGKNLPVDVELIDILNDQSLSMTIDYDGKGGVKLSDIVYNGTPENSVIKANLGDTIAIAAGHIVIEPNGTEKAQKTPGTIYFTKRPMQSAVDSYVGQVNVSQNDKSDIIKLSINDVSTQRAEDILNTLIKVYNENWVAERNQIAVSTSMFISDRLGVIENELGDVDSDISDFKSEHLLPDVSQAASMAMQQANQANTAVRDLENQVYMARYVRNYLANSANNFNLLPVTSGVTDAGISGQIAAYNNLLMDRNSLVTNSSENNPLVQEMDKNLADLRSALVASIDNQILALNSQIRSMSGFGAQATSKIASNPKQSKYLLSVERQQKVKESLYLYLLQKREENELSQAFTAYNTRIVAAPRGSNVPTEPQKTRILLMAFVIGLAIPLAIIVLIEMMNTKVRGRKDLEVMTAPLVGEIPQATPDKKSSKDKKQIKRPIVVKPKSRNSVNEAFRMVRTNLEFMTPKDKNVIAITSANPGSGKTFITYNLSLSFAIKEKRVLILDLDLRKGSMSKYIGAPKPGITDYLVGKTDSIADIMYPAYETMEQNLSPDKGFTSMYIIPVGTVPPNPTELLFNDRLGQLIEQLRTEFDYIFIDCPPVEVVADASIINKLVDQTIFVIRAGLLDRSMLSEIENFYTTKKYKNITLLLNGTISAGRYGYKYGYSYGYKYGYSTKGYTND